MQDIEAVTGKAITKVETNDLDVMEEVSSALFVPTTFVCPTKPWMVFNPVMI